MAVGEPKQEVPLHSCNHSFNMIPIFENQPSTTLSLPSCATYLFLLPRDPDQTMKNAAFKADLSSLGAFTNDVSPQAGRGLSSF